MGEERPEGIWSHNAWCIDKRKNSVVRDDYYYYNPKAQAFLTSLKIDDFPTYFHLYITIQNREQYMLILVVF